MKFKKNHLSKIIFVCLLTSFNIANAITVNDLNREFNSYGKTLPSGELEHTFCYASDSSRLEVNGVNIDSSVRLASVSKVITSFWAISSLGPHYQFETHLSYSAKTRHLHISGSSDPFMGQQSLFFIASELDRLGIQDIDLLTFDSKFLVYEFADVRSSYEGTVGAQSNPPAQDSQIAVLKYLNTRNWSQNFSRLYAQLRSKSFAMGIRMVAAPKVSVRNAMLDETDDMKYESGALHLTYDSEELYKYLKHMNAYSINYAANIIFRNLGGTDAFEKFISRKLRMRTNAVTMYTGSGLEYYTDGEVTRRDRVDNESTCENVLKITAALDSDLKVYGLSLADVLLVAGVDQGTWSGSSTVTGAIAAKTGTLVDIPVSNLMGMASTQSGDFYFGMFFQMRDRQEMDRAHAIETSMADNIVAANGGRNAVPLAALSESFLPFRENLK